MHQLRREWRGKEALQAGLVLAATFLLVALFAASDLRGQAAASVIVVWLPIVYACAAVLARTLAADADRGVLDLMRTAPVPAEWHGVARTVANAAFCAIVAALSLAGASALFAIPASAPLAAVVGLGVAGLAIVGTLASGLAAQARSREALLPILLVPVAAPLLHSAVSATLAAIGGGGWEMVRTPLLLMAGYDLVAAGIAWLLWPTVLEGD